MGTKANIGIIKNGKILRIYCHNDGGPEKAGQILAEHYNTTEKVNALLALGGLVHLGETPETCVAHHRDHGGLYDLSIGPAYRATVDYVYLWDPRRNEWLPPFVRREWVTVPEAP